ncbi:MAG: GNAT family N-acetyltransferase [Anaerolineae bacterium]|nr:GNAT family N-acetyltransferase [Anaerolineae bacterium]
MKLQGQRITIRHMKAADLDAMLQWRPFADPLYRPFDFPRQSRSEHMRWFEWRRRDPSRRLYTIVNEDRQVIGSLTLREIDGRRSARLGITIGADFVSQGYGTEAMHIFLDHYFGEMGFATMVLDVAATNLRAVRAYRAIGFRETGQHYRPASHPSYRILQKEPRYRHLWQFFQRTGGVATVLFYDMSMTREEWRVISQSLENAQAGK